MRPILSLIALVLVFAACGATARERTIHTTLVSVNAARDGFVAYDREHQLELVAKAETEAELAAAHAKYIDKRATVVKAFEAAYRAIAIAAVVNDDPKSLVNLAQAASILLEALRDLTGGKLP